MGRTSFVDFVSNFTDRTSPSRPVMTSFTRASGHDPRGEFSSMINTTSSFRTLGISFSHFWRRCNSGKYSRTQRFQNRFAKYCTCRHLRWYIFPSFTFVHGYEKLPLSIRRWFGVKGSLSVASSLTFVIGRLSTIFSASQNTVLKLTTLERATGSVDITMQWNKTVHHTTHSFLTLQFKCSWSATFCDARVSTTKKKKESYIWACYTT